NGGEFIAQVVQNVLKTLKVEDIRISPYSPNVDGQVERPNGTLKMKLGMMTQQLKKPWSLVLPFVLANYNNQVHSTTGVAPCLALRGRTNTILDNQQTQNELLTQQMQLHLQIRVNTQRAAQRMVERHKKKSKVITFNEGNFVLCRLLLEKRKKCKKGTPTFQYEGTIAKVYKNNRYRIMWGSTGGPTKKEKPGTLSSATWSSKNLKLVPKESTSCVEDPLEETGTKESISEVEPPEETTSIESTSEDGSPNQETISKESPSDEKLSQEPTEDAITNNSSQVSRLDNY